MAPLETCAGITCGQSASKSDCLPFNLQTHQSSNERLKYGSVELEMYMECWGAGIELETRRRSAAGRRAMRVEGVRASRPSMPRACEQ